MKHGILMLLALSLATGAAAAESPSSAIMMTQDSWDAEHAQGQAVLAWVGAHAPKFPPITQRGTVKVERVQRFAGAEDMRSSPSGALPEKGSAGEKYSVENTLLDGTVQSWTFQWNETSSSEGEKWVVTAYTYRKGNDPLNTQ